MSLDEFSPITQRRASTRFDLPQPFGPTTPVRPGSILNSVGSQKLLKPARRSRSNFMGLALWSSIASRRARPASSRLSRCEFLRQAAIKRRGDQAPRRRNLCETGLFRRRRQRRVKGRQRRFAVELVAVDEERRRRIEAETLGGGIARPLTESNSALSFTQARKSAGVRPVSRRRRSSGSSRNAHSSWLANSRSISASRLSGPAQRAAMNAAMASGSSGNSRRMNLALPVSTYLAFSAGHTCLWKAAQWLQVIEAYSMIVAGALGRAFDDVGQRSRLHQLGGDRRVGGGGGRRGRRNERRETGRPEARHGLSKPCHDHFPRIARRGPPSGRRGARGENSRRPAARQPALAGGG